ncbi:MAG: hypothetical protein AAF191_05125 [Verrucomicrobiota bacterium]
MEALFRRLLAERSERRIRAIHMGKWTERVRKSDRTAESWEDRLASQISPDTEVARGEKTSPLGDGLKGKRREGESWAASVGPRDPPKREEMLVDRSSLSFVERESLRGKRTLMLYRGRSVGSGRSFIAYILCPELSTIRMYDDYQKGNRVDTIEDYGEVVYVADTDEPDEDALAFIAEWKQKNGFS